MESSRSVSATAAFLEYCRLGICAKVRFQNYRFWPFSNNFISDPTWASRQRSSYHEPWRETQVNGLISNNSIIQLAATTFPRNNMVTSRNRSNHPWTIKATAAAVEAVTAAPVVAEAVTSMILAKYCRTPLPLLCLCLPSLSAQQCILPRNSTLRWKIRQPCPALLTHWWNSAWKRSSFWTWLVDYVLTSLLKSVSKLMEPPCAVYCSKSKTIKTFH